MEHIEKKTKEPVVLSVLIICHNQKDVVKRCIESVLQQKTTFTKEIIVSDDRSTDGTREMLLNEYKDIVIPTFFDSNKCDTSFTLERAGYNRLNGLKLATGKYIIHTDGDDIFTSTDLFQTMVDTLEAHPECNLCCQNYCEVDADNLNAPHIPKNTSPLLKQDGILSAQNFFYEVRPLVNACYCARRASFNSQKLWGGTYDDNYITARYIGDGKVAVLNRCDFVYVKYGHSSCAMMSNDEKRILFQPAIGIAELAPAVAGTVLRRYTKSFYVVSKQAVLRKPITDNIGTFCGKFDGFILNKLSKSSNLLCWLRYFMICLVSAFMIGTKYKPKCLVSLLYRLAIGKITNDVII